MSLRALILSSSLGLPRHRVRVMIRPGPRRRPAMSSMYSQISSTARSSHSAALLGRGSRRVADHAGLRPAAPLALDRERPVRPVHPGVLRLPVGDLAHRLVHLHQIGAGSPGRATSRARRRAPYRPGTSDERVRARSSADFGELRYQKVAAIASRSSSMMSRAAMSTSGTFDPCPFTKRIRRKPWCKQAPADVDEVVDERLPADRDRAREVHVVGRVAVRHRREKKRPPRSRRYRPVGQRLGDHDVGVDRQVVAVVLERRDRDDEHRVARDPLGTSGQVSSA